MDISIFSDNEKKSCLKIDTPRSTSCKDFKNAILCSKVSGCNFSLTDMKCIKIDFHEDTSTCLDMKWASKEYCGKIITDG